MEHRLGTEILGVEFDAISLEEAVAQGKTWLGEEGFHYVVTPNPEFILMAQKDEVFRQTLNQADMVLPDGIGVVYAGKILGKPLKGRVPGIDFGWGLLEYLNDTGGKLFLLGAKDGVPQQAKALLCGKYPNLQVCGTHHGYFKEDQDQEVAKLIADSGADVLFACLGAPRQEIFLSKWGPQTGVRIAVGLGGALDVFAGTVNRAPVLWQKMNAEWLYRLVKEPKRWKRMIKLPLVLLQAMKQRLFPKKKTVV